MQRLLVRVGGSTVLDEPAPFFSAPQEQVYVGANPIGLSTSRTEFSGDLFLENVP
jgi:hypothetical protein